MVLSLYVGCSSPPTPVGEWTPIADIPADVLTVAQKTLPEVNFESARKFAYQGQDAFEIRGKQANGKLREVEVTIGGEVVEVE